MKRAGSGRRHARRSARAGETNSSDGLRLAGWSDRAHLPGAHLRGFVVVRGGRALELSVAVEQDHGDGGRPVGNHLDHHSLMAALQVFGVDTGFGDDLEAAGGIELVGAVKIAHGIADWRSWWSLDADF